MNHILRSLGYAYPECIVLIGAVLVLIVNFGKSKLVRQAGLAISVLSLIIAMFYACMPIGDSNKIIFSGLYVHNAFTQAMKLITCGTVILHFIYSFKFLEKYEINIGDYCCLTLLATLGMLVLISSYSLLTVYLGLEVLSLPLYALIAINRNSIQGAEAAMKYFVMGSVASSILLYGMSLIYGVTGTLEFPQISTQISLLWSQNQGMLTLGTIFIIVGIGFKLSQVPFHSWAPDVYEGAPFSITLLLSTAPKIAVVALMLLIFGGAFINMSYQWQQVMTAMAIISILVGNLFALLQTNFRRLLAYSAIAHMGYALLGIITVTEAGFAATTFYIIVYALTTTAALGFLVLTATEVHSYDQLVNLKGLNKTRPYLAAGLSIILLSLAGIPPTGGFLSKFWILKTLMDSDHVLLTIAALVFAVIGAVYYIRIIKQIYFDAPENQQLEMHKIEITPTQKIVYATNIALILLLGIVPTSLISYISMIIPK